MSLPMEIDCAGVKQLLDTGEKFVFVDCREQDEFDRVRIPGTTLLPMSQIQDRLGDLPPDKTARVVVHCHHGGRSLRVAKWLRDQGFASSQSMAGGIDDWAVKIDPSLARY